MKFEEQGKKLEDMNNVKQEKIQQLGSLLHDEWREPRKQEDGTFEARVKVLVKTSEGAEKWFNEGDSNIPQDAQEIKRQDIANTPFEQLDPKWQEDNRLAAEVAMGEVFKGVEGDHLLDDQAFIESASSIIHDEWLKRNGWQATEVQKKPYEELPEDEKEKDRVQLKKALEIYKSKELKQETRVEKSEMEVAESSERKEQLVTDTKIQESTDNKKIEEIREKLSSI